MNMTYPTFARLFYVAVVAWLLGAGILLDSIGAFQFVAIVLLVAGIAGYWASFVVLICPECGEFVGQSKFGYYKPWMGPACHHCGANLSSRQVSFVPRQ